MNSLSVVIPTKDRADALARTLDALEAQQAGDAKLEAIVIDNGSSDDTVEQVQRRAESGALPIRLLEQPERRTGRRPQRRRPRPQRRGPALPRRRHRARRRGPAARPPRPARGTAGAELRRAGPDHLDPAQPGHARSCAGSRTAGPSSTTAELDARPGRRRQLLLQLARLAQALDLRAGRRLRRALPDRRGRGHRARRPPRRRRPRARLPPRAARPPRPPDHAGPVAAPLGRGRPLRRPLQPAAARPAPSRRAGAAGARLVARCAPPSRCSAPSPACRCPRACASGSGWR